MSNGGGGSSANSNRSFLLSQKVGIPDKLAPGVLLAMNEHLGREPTLRDLEKFGVAGLRALAAAVERELEDQRRLQDKEDVTVYVQSSHGGKLMKFVAKETETIKALVEKHPEELGELLECACGGIAACSTCHVIVDGDHFAGLPEVEEAEMDMLDLAAGVTETSRLGCQLRLTKKCDGMVLTIPDEVHNLY